MVIIGKTIQEIPICVQNFLSFNLKTKRLWKDLSNWTFDQLDIFVGAIIPLEDGSEESLITYRSFLYTHILAFVDDKSFLYLVNHIEFINWGESKSIYLLYKIRDKIERLEYKEREIEQIGYAIEKANAGKND